ncbi:aromatic ring-hydroxylating oxygenase subunit alpha [Gordonia sp. DT30]|uniref:aromatic ring-hydroxylating oxygenase subunit alpha n=1 Tax=Gordonia sp. DT30 TaxID=3416546 RepID=UPI003CF379A0
MSDLKHEKHLSDTPEARNDRVRKVIKHLKEGTTDSFDEIAHISHSEYTDPALAEAERELIFGRVPSIVAHGSEIANPGMFITLQMPRNKVIVVRQKDGSVKAFVNACRHRGALLESEPSGKCRLFSCPYHRWSYDTDGSLRTITREDTFGDLEHDDLSLVELPAEERHGFVWVADSADGAIDVADWLGPDMDSILASYEMDRLVTYRAEIFEQPVNWKLMQDAFLDGYHIQYAHPNTAGKYIHTNVSVVEDYGRHSRWIKPRKSIDRWIEDDPADRPMEKYLIETHFIGPNSTLLKQHDHFELLTFRPHPTDPNLGYMDMRVIPPRSEDTELDEEAWNNLWEKNWDILLRVLHAEDFPILRGTQEAMQSSDTGRMVLGKNELANHIFRRETLKLLGA